jgi:hypothetical protein
VISVYNNNNKMKSKHDEINSMHELYSFQFQSKIHYQIYVLYYTWTWDYGCVVLVHTTLRFAAFPHTLLCLRVNLHRVLFWATAEYFPVPICSQSKPPTFFPLFQSPRGPEIPKPQAKFPVVVVVLSNSPWAGRTSVAKARAQAHFEVGVTCLYQDSVSDRQPEK